MLRGTFVKREGKIFRGIDIGWRTQITSHTNDVKKILENESVIDLEGMQ